MSSDRYRRVAALFLFVTLAACGKQGDPQPRPRTVPQPARDLTVRQRGLDLLVDLSYPRSTVAGLPLEGLDSVTIYEAIAPLGGDGKLPTFTDAELDRFAKPVIALTGAALAEAILGDRIRGQLTLPASAIEAKEARIYAARTQATRGGLSPWSNVVALRPLEAPAAPADLDAAARKQGVALTWTLSEGAVGYVVLRRDATNPTWGAPLATLPAAANTFVDRGALYGSRYVYTVLALAQTAPPIESAPQSAREVDYRDLFPPQVPTQLAALVVGGQIRLVWDASADADLAGYFVERSERGLEFRPLSETPLVALEYTDETAPSGILLRYRILAVDQLGNASPPTAPVETRRP